MLAIMPKELINKVHYKEREVHVNEGIKLTAHEEKILEEFRTNLKEMQKMRFE